MSIFGQFLRNKKGINMNKNKKIILFSIVFIILFGIGCVEDNQLQPQEKQYTQIYSSGTLTVETYDDYGNFLDIYSEPFSETMPYTDYDWNGNVDMDEWIGSMFTEYNYLKTIYDVVERPAPDKVNGKFRVEIYVDGGYMVMSCVYTATRY